MKKLFLVSVILLLAIDSFAQQPVDTTLCSCESDSYNVLNGIHGKVDDILDDTFEIKSNTTFGCKQWAELIAVFCTLFFSCLTYFSQKKTQQNTKQISKTVQKSLLCDLLRHLYRNYVITYALRSRMEEKDYNCYPSEEHLIKLQIPLERIHLEAFANDEDANVEKMHMLLLNLRNYNDEVLVALEHFKNPSIPRAIKEGDFDTLEFKISYLTGKIVDTINDIWYKDEDNIESMKKALNLSLSGASNTQGNMDVLDSGNFTPMTLEKLKSTNYSKIYKDEELNIIACLFNNDVKEERKKNSRGAWKLRVIDFY